MYKHIINIETVINFDQLKVFVIFKQYVRTINNLKIFCTF